MKKRLVAMLTLLVLLVGIFSVSLADTKPTATLLKSSKNQTVAPGKTIHFTFKLDSGSYDVQDDAFRAKLQIQILKDSKQIGKANWLWTGKQTYKVNAKIEKTAVAGKYFMKYNTYFRKTATSKWTLVKSAKTKFTVKKK